jgi:Enoyl-CoA hydratase/isomerase
MISAEEIVGASEQRFGVKDYGRVRIIVINRPKARNALTRQMRRDFPRYIQSAEQDESIAVVILTGTGMGTAFSAGVDLKERAEGPPQPPVVPNPGEVLRDSRKPVIAAVNGAYRDLPVYRRAAGRRQRHRCAADTSLRSPYRSPSRMEH